MPLRVVAGRSSIHVEGLAIDFAFIEFLAKTFLHVGFPRWLRAGFITADVLLAAERALFGALAVLEFRAVTATPPVEFELSSARKLQLTASRALTVRTCSRPQRQLCRPHPRPMARLEGELVTVSPSCRISR